MCNSFGADPTNIRALLKGDARTKQWCAAELKAICQRIASLFEITETRIVTADALEARDKLIKRESAVQSRIHNPTNPLVLAGTVDALVCGYLRHVS